MNLVADIALTHLRGRLRQSVVAIAGIATGVGFSVGMAALMEGSQKDFIDTLIDATPHIVIKDEFREPRKQPVAEMNPGGAVSLRGVKPKEELRGIRNAKARLAEVEKLPGVTAAPILRGQVVMRFGGKDIAASLIGIEIERERRVSSIEDDMRTGSLDALYRVANGVVMGTGLAERLGAGMGDTLTVSSPAGAILKMKIVGLFRTGVVAIDNTESYALLKKVQVLQNRPNVVNQIRIRLPDARQARAAALRIENLVGYRSESWEEANEGFLEVLVIRNVIMYTVVGAILMVASFGIFNVISTMTHEKTRDIAILKSLGFREAHIRRIFVLESLFLGILGCALGWLLGWALTVIVGSIDIDVQGLTEMKRLPVIYSAWHYAIATGFALTAAGFAGWLPARKAARLDPVDIVRGAA
jgi:lipoprotein-releasing system permease protein